MDDLPSSPLLAALPLEEAKGVLESARRRTFARDEVVFHEGDPGDSLHVITEGRFAVSRTTPLGHSPILAVLGEGEVFGEIAPLRWDGRRVATVVALEPGETRSIERGDLLLLRAKYPGLTEALLLGVSDKLVRYTRLLLEALDVSAEARVLLRLLELSEIYGPGGSIPVTQESLARMAFTSRATVNRVLCEQRRHGHLRLGRGRVTILDRSSLVSAASP